MSRIGKYLAATGPAWWPSDTALVVKKAPELEEVEKALKAFDEYRKVPGNNDHIVLSRLLWDIHDANEKFAKTNKAASDAIDAQVANAIVNEVSPENRVVLLQQHTNLRIKRQEAAKKLDNKKKTLTADTSTVVAVAKEDVSKTQLNAMNKRAGLTEAVDAKDNNPRQAQAFVKGLEKILERTNPKDTGTRNAGVAELLQAIKVWIKSEVGEGGTRTTSKLSWIEVFL